MNTTFLKRPIGGVLFALLFLCGAIFVQGRTQVWHGPGKSVLFVKTQQEVAKPITEEEIRGWQQGRAAQIRDIFVAYSPLNVRPLVESSLMAGLKATSEIRRWFEVTLKERPSDEELQRLIKSGWFAAIETDSERELSFSPNDSLFGRQDFLKQIRAESAWDIVQGDSLVVIAIVDNGVDILHQDLGTNILVNPLEFSGQSGMDDDGNGLIDDIYGYDFADNDAWPGPTAMEPAKSRHGTHVAGIAAAVGQNGTGVIGVAWKSKILPIKVFPDTDPEHTYTKYAVPGIVYALNRGARIINLSWGGYQFNQAEKDAIDLAWNNGALVVAAAGNNGNSDFYYPADYHHVVSVAAVDNQDRLALFSNLNLAVDLTAPGVNLLSTLPGDQYGEMSGTSVAAPIVAGIAALVKSYRPAMDIENLQKQVVLSAQVLESSEGLTTFNHWNRLRADALRAVSSETVLLDEAPRIRIKQIIFDDSNGGDGNGQIEPGERIEIWVELSDFSLSAGHPISVVGRELNESSLQWQQQEVQVESFQDSTFFVANPLTFVFLSDRTEFIPLSIEVLFEGNVIAADTVVAHSYPRPVLLINNTGGSGEAETYYFHSLESLGIPFGYWDVSLLGQPELPILNRHAILIWFFDRASSPLSTEERNTIREYLAAGGRLLVCGENVARDLSVGNTASTESQEFLTNTLGVDFVLDDVRERELVAQDGHLTAALLPQESQRMNFSPDALSAVEFSKPIFIFPQSRLAGTVLSGRQNVAFLGLGLETVSTPGRILPITTDSVRIKLLQELLDLLHPLKRDVPGNVVWGQGQLAGRVVYTDLTGESDSLILHYRYEGENRYRQTLLTKTDSVFVFLIPEPATPGRMDFYFEIHAPHYSWYSPIAGATEPMSVRFVNADIEAPEIVNVRGPDAFLKKAGLIWKAAISDNILLDTASVFLHIMGSDSVEMRFSSEEDLFVALDSSHYHYGDTLIWWLSAADANSIPNYGKTAAETTIVGFEGFENGLQNWRFTGEGWWLDANGPFQGDFCLSTFPEMGYRSDQNIAIQPMGLIDLSTDASIELQFHTRYAIESGDRGVVEIRGSDSTWRVVAGPFSGYQGQWKLVRSDLSPYAGQKLALRFRFESNQYQTMSLPGWFIDAVRIVEGEHVTGISYDQIGLPNQFQLAPGFPNPFANQICFQLFASATRPPEVTIFNLLGQVIFSDKMTTQTPGEYIFLWDGRDMDGRRLPAGLYFLRVRSGNYSAVQKILFWPR